MNPLYFVKAAPWAIAFVMAVAAFVLGKSYLSVRDEFSAYRAKTEAIAAAQQAAVERAREEGKKNLELLEQKYESNLPAVRRLAVNNYIAWMREQSPMQPKPDSNSSGQQVDDDPQREPVVDRATSEFVGQCGEDARKLDAWIAYCTLNRCPVKE